MLHWTTDIFNPAYLICAYWQCVDFTLWDRLRTRVVLGFDDLRSRERGTRGLVSHWLWGLTVVDCAASCQTGNLVSITLCMLGGQIQHTG